MWKRIILVLVCLVTFSSQIGCKNADAGMSDIEKQEKANQIIQKYTEKSNKEKAIEEFKEKQNVELTSKEVQHNMTNNIDKPFLLEGKATLADYYNYGFDDSIEEKYFVVTVEPTGGEYSDYWYLYCHRDSFEDLFDILLDKSDVYIAVKAKIPKNAYRDGQGNMALAETIAW